jgi:hypothetical protein
MGSNDRYPLEAYVNAFQTKYAQDRQSAATPLTALSNFATQGSDIVAKTREEQKKNKFELMKDGLKKQRLFVKDSNDSPERMPTVEEIGTGYSEVLNSLNGKKGKMRAGQNGTSEFLINDKIYIFKPVETSEDENASVYNYDSRKGKLYDLKGVEVTGPIPKGSIIRNMDENEGGRYGLLKNDPEYQMKHSVKLEKYKEYVDSVAGKNEIDPKIAKAKYDEASAGVTKYIKSKYDFNDEELSIITTGGFEVPGIGKVSIPGVASTETKAVTAKEKEIYATIDDLKKKGTKKEAIKAMLKEAKLDPAKYGY